MNGDVVSWRSRPGKGFVWFAFTILLLLITAGTIAAPPGGNWRERALAFADSQHMFGPLQTSGQPYTGSFVRFRFDQNTATITDYTVVARSRTTAVFRTVAPESASFGALSVNGTIFEYTSATLRIAVFNNPTSAILVNSTSSMLNMTFDLSSGINARRNGQSLNLSTTDLTAKLFVTGTATLTLVGSQAVARLPPGTAAIFRANSLDGENAAGAAGQTILADAAVGRLLALETFQIGFEGYVEASDVEYSGTSRRGSNLTANGFTVDIGVEQTSSVLVALHIHKSMMGGDVQSPFQVHLDGKNIAKLAGLGDVVADNGTAATFAMVVSGNGTLILLRIPDAGIHVLSVQRILPPPVDQGLNPLQLLAIAAIVLVLLGAAAAFMLRRKPA